MNSDSATAQRVVTAINLQMRRTVASAVDGGLIEIQGPLSPNERTNFMARIESIEVLPIQARPKVILDSRTGSVVLNSSVKPARRRGPRQPVGHHRHHQHGQPARRFQWRPDGDQLPEQYFHRVPGRFAAPALKAQRT
jgi:hypothetical protein